MQHVCVFGTLTAYFNRWLAAFRHVFPVSPNDPQSLCGHRSYQLPARLKHGHILITYLFRRPQSFTSCKEYRTWTFNGNPGEALRSFYTSLNTLSTSRHCEIRIYDIDKFYKKLYHNQDTVTVIFFTWYYLYIMQFQLLIPWMKSHGITIQMKHLQQYFHIVLFI